VVGRGGKRMDLGIRERGVGTSRRRETEIAEKAYSDMHTAYHSRRLRPGRSHCLDCIRKRRASSHNCRERALHYIYRCW
jgi:hypothetical protein